MRRRPCFWPTGLEAWGYTYATKAGISIALKDMGIPEKKQEFLDLREPTRSPEIETQYQKGLITDGERYNKVIDIWADSPRRSPRR